jgi:two-component system LytT family response regulator
VIKTIIIDDEVSGRKTLSWLLEEYCPELELVGMADGVDSGVKLIDKSNPDLVFLDIELTPGSGFDILEQCPNANFEVIFVTAYDEYAIKAFRFSAVDYLVKPVNVEDLQKSIKRIKKQDSGSVIKQQIETLLANIKGKEQKLSKLAIPTQDGYELIDTAEIIWCESDGSYTKFHTKSRSIMASKTMGEFETMLTEQGFFRIHRTHMINFNHITRYIKGRGGCILMNDGTELAVSRYRKDELLERMKKG